jgi:hypothetical protein
VLLEERAVILDACAAAIGECDAPEISPTQALVAKAIAALRDGHDEAGMALAVSVGEGLAHWAVVPRVQAFDSQRDHEQWRAKWDERRRRSKYRLIDLVMKPAEDVEAQDFLQQLLIAPIEDFFKPLRPGEPVPSVFSRHVVAHEPSVDHMTTVNALKSVMLVIGIVRSQQGWITEIAEPN